MALALAINGAAGRMGARLIAQAGQCDDLRVVAAIEAAGSRHLGRDAGEAAGISNLGVPIRADCGVAFDVMIDFSVPGGTLRALETCLRARRPIVIGTTGHAGEELGRIDAATKEVAVVHAANMSVGVNVLLRLTRELARTLGPEYDVEIVETHHRHKVDAPSGTALALCDAVRQGRGAAEHLGRNAAAGDVVHGRSGQTGQRPVGQIGVHALRIGDAVGDHAVHFGTEGETICVSHHASSRDIFVAGALRAARWIANRPAGRYSMQDVLFGESPGG